MQKAFDLIVEKFKEEKMSYFLTIANTGDEKLDSIYKAVANAIDRNIEIVNQVAEEYKPKAIATIKIDGEQLEELVAKAVAELRENIENSNDGWIPCSSGYPKARYLFDDETEKKFYIVQRKDGLMEIAERINLRGDLWMAHSLEIKDVIAWRELPQPYQPKGE